MVAVGVGADDRGDPFVPRRRQQRIDMRGQVRARIDHRDLARSDDIAVGAGEGERGWIVRQQPAHAGRDPFDLSHG